MKDYIKRPQDVSKAVRLLRQEGVRIGLPMQKANGQMVFPVEEFTLSAGDILELFDKDELNLAAVRRLGEAQKANPPHTLAQPGSKT
jgi:hypothetical protein